MVREFEPLRTSPGCDLVIFAAGKRSFYVLKEPIYDVVSFFVLDHVLEARYSSSD